MVKIANKNGSEYTTDKDEFRGSNTFAEWHEGKYVVYSYGRHFPMYVYKASTQTWYENKDKYSVSTSKQQTQLRPNLFIKNAFHMKNTNELNKIIRG